MDLDSSLDSDPNGLFWTSDLTSLNPDLLTFKLLIITPPPRNVQRLNE